MKVAADGDSLYAEPAADNDPFWFNGYVDESYLFDRQGRTTEYHAYQTDDADDNKTLNRYDADGRLASQYFYGDRESRGHLAFSYDEAGRITAVTRFDARGDTADVIYHLRKPHEPIPLNRSKNNIWQYTYNPAGQVTEQTALFPDGRVNFRQVYFYDDRGRQTQVVTFDAAGQKQSSQSYRYNKQGLISSIRYVSGLKMKITSYRYNPEGDEIDMKQTEVDLQALPADSLVSNQRLSAETLGESTSLSHAESQYRYDDAGNWIERFYFLDGKPLFAQRREITYY
jgi:YD repeat-containing protein